MTRGQRRTTARALPRPGHRAAPSPRCPGAVLASCAGTTGTIIGTAVASVIATVGAATTPGPCDGPATPSGAPPRRFGRPRCSPTRCPAPSPRGRCAAGRPGPETPDPADGARTTARTTPVRRWDPSALPWARSCSRARRSPSSRSAASPPSRPHRPAGLVATPARTTPRAPPSATSWARTTSPRSTTDEPRTREPDDEATAAPGAEPNAGPEAPEPRCLPSRRRPAPAQPTDPPTSAPTEEPSLPPAETEPLRRPTPRRPEPTRPHPDGPTGPRNFWTTGNGFACPSGSVPMLVMKRNGFVSSTG